MTTDNSSNSQDPVTERLTRLVGGEAVDPKELALPESGKVNPLEQWARLEADKRGLDLALTLPLGLVMVAAMCHGAYRVRALDYVTTTTVQYVGQASSGVGKTTLLGAAEKVMSDAMEAGEDAMQAWVADRIANLPQGVLLTDWEKVYRKGLCTDGFLLGSSTMEGLRNGLRDNGSHQVIWTAESDILEEINKYLNNGKEAGSVTMLLHGWDGETIRVRRVSEGMIRAEKASVPMVLLLQPSAFDKATSSAMFITKGMLHRMLITRSTATVEVPDAGPLPGLEALSSELEEARLAFGDRLERLARSTAVHASMKAVREAWRGGGGTGTGVPRPDTAKERHLELADDAAVAAFLRVQRVRADMRRAATMDDAAAINTGTSAALWEPLASRLTDHVLRIAANYRLALDPDAHALTAGDIEDALERVLPWLWEHWALCMGMRNTASLEEATASAIKENPRGLDTSLDGHLLRAFGLVLRSLHGMNLAKDRPITKSPAVPRSAVLKRARDLIRGDAKASAYREFEKILDRLIAEGYYVVAEDGYNGHPAVCLTVNGQHAAAAQMK